MGNSSEPNQFWKILEVLSFARHLEYSKTIPEEKAGAIT